MALATRCPHCHTTFRVAHDQLKLRAGIVRCGACKQIFNGIENLLPPEEAASSLVPGIHDPVPVVSAEPKEVSLPAQELSDLRTTDLPEPIAGAFTINSLDFDVPIESQQADEMPSGNPSVFSSVMKADNAFTSADFTKAEYRVDESQEPILSSEAVVAPDFSEDMGHVGLSDFSEDVALSLPAVLPSTQQDDGRTELKAAGEVDGHESDLTSEPGFIKKWQQQQRAGKMRRILMGVTSIILFVGLLGQGVYVFRKHVAAWFPSTEPILAQLCSKMGCQNNLPAQITVVSIESSELQALVAGKNTFALTLLLGNHSQLTQAWPNIELTLNDANEQPVARRIFMPNEYLTSAAAKGIPANTEQPVKLFFELTQLKASGYRVYLFYS